MATTLKQLEERFTALEAEVAELRKQLGARPQATVRPDREVTVSCRKVSCNQKGKVLRSQAKGWACSEHAAA